MKAFKDYKAEMDKTNDGFFYELRDLLFSLIDIIDFKSFDSLTESILNLKNAKFESHNMSSSIIEFLIDGNTYLMYYNKTNETACFLNSKYQNIRVICNVRSKMIVEINTEYGTFEQVLKPKIESITLKNDIRNYLFKSSKSIEQVFIYDSSIDIDETIRASCFIFLNRNNLVLDLKGTFKNDNIRIKNLNIFRYSDSNKSKIDAFNPVDLNIEDIKIIFSSLKSFDEGSLLNQMIESKGIEILDDELFNKILNINVYS